MAQRQSHRPRLEVLEDRLLPSGHTVPALSSLPGAAATLYLDFDGHFEAEWGSYTNVTTPAYDIDGDPANFSAGELVNIENIWRIVAEDYAPFNLNVTTLAPASFDNGAALRVVIGGNSAWTGATQGGLSFINSFTNSLVNTAYVFSEVLGNDPRAIADAAAHEAGHTFGLAHQRLWDGPTKVAEYQDGPGDGTAPLLGDSYSATRSLWWYGTTSSATTFQNDMEVIAGNTNGFGYRPDDHGNTAATATTLNVSSTGDFSVSGVIAKMDDLDYFRFNSPGGVFTFTVTVPAGNNLDPRLELRDSDGNLVAAVNPAGSFDASLTYPLAAGDYFLVVASAGVSSVATGGNYGFNVGQYTLSGGVAAPGAEITLGLPWINTRKNESFATAKKLALDPAGENGFVTDLNNVANVDYYKLRLPADSDGAMTITMSARDLSLLMPKLSVYNASFKRIAKIGGDAGSAVTLRLAGLRPGKVFYIVADGPQRKAFGAGDYRLNVQVGLFGTPASGAFTPTSSSGTLAAALALDGGARQNIGEITLATLESISPKTKTTFAGFVHFQAPMQRRSEKLPVDLHVLLENTRSHGAGRRRGLLRTEARLLEKAGLLHAKTGRERNSAD